MYVDAEREKQRQQELRAEVAGKPTHVRLWLDAAGKKPTHSAFMKLRLKFKNRLLKSGFQACTM